MIEDKKIDAYWSKNLIIIQTIESAGSASTLAQNQITLRNTWAHVIKILQFLAFIETGINLSSVLQPRGRCTGNSFFVHIVGISCMIDGWSVCDWNSTFSTFVASACRQPFLLILFRTFCVVLLNCTKAAPSISQESCEMIYAHIYVYVLGGPTVPKSMSHVCISRFSDSRNDILLRRRKKFNFLFDITLILAATNNFSRRKKIWMRFANFVVVESISTTAQRGYWIARVYCISKTFLSLSPSPPASPRILSRRDACRIASGISCIVGQREVASTREASYSVSILVSWTVTREIFRQTRYAKFVHSAIMQTDANGHGQRWLSSAFPVAHWDFKVNYCSITFN